MRAQIPCSRHAPRCSLAAVLRKLGLVFAALALFSIAGGHWALLQSVACAEMRHAYSQHTGSIAAAVEQTFDGQHPCELCQEIQAAKAKEHKDPPTAPSTKDDAKVKALLADSVLPAFMCMTEDVSFPRAVFASSASRAEQPPTPPPRRSILAA